MSNYIDITAITNVIGNAFNNPKLFEAEDKYFFNEEDFVTDFQKVVFGAMFNLHQLGAKGFAFSLVAVIPQNMIIVPTILVLSVLSISFSLKLILASKELESVMTGHNS